MRLDLKELNGVERKREVGSGKERSVTSLILFFRLPLQRTGQELSGEDWKGATLLKRDGVSRRMNIIQLK